jgi:hypothetical protein
VGRREGSPARKGTANQGGDSGAGGKTGALQKTLYCIAAELARYCLYPRRTVTHVLDMYHYLVLPSCCN